MVLLFAGIATAVLLGRDDPRPDPSATSDTPRASNSPDPTARASTEASAPTPTSTTPETSASASSGSSAPGPAPAPADDAQQAVVDYYALLPDDTETAWTYLGPDARASAGGYSGFSGFWSTVDSVSVEGASTSGDAVRVDLTYNGSESETRELVVTRHGDGWQISEDRGAV